jgi:histidinol dehydrogenase
MKTYFHPDRNSWAEILARPSLEIQNLDLVVSTILDDVRKQGDAAVRRYTARFDQAQIQEPEVMPQEFEAARNALDDSLRQAILVAKENIARFHAAQAMPVMEVETMPGVRCSRKSVPIQKVGLYVPGGTAPLFSSVLMLGVPAVLAGCPEIILCTPPSPDGTVHPAILFAAEAVGIRRVFKIGGVQAIGAMAFGTESVPMVFKIFGPGNQYVTTAKQIVSRMGIAIDMPAGPSEVLVLADHSAIPAFVAADLLSQAEHGPDSQVVLVAMQESFVAAVQNEINLQLESLPRKEIARQALAHSIAIIARSEDEAMDLVNLYAPEHLILATENAGQLAQRVINAGSVFLGNFTPESVGDYASGTNHTLPTNGFARAFSGASLDSFVKKITFQELSADGLRRIAPTVEAMAEAESLHAHAAAVRIRLLNQPV